MSRAPGSISTTPTVKAPISGRIGRALVTEGALVGQGEATHLATIQQLNTVYADFTQSVGELNQLRRALAKGDLEAAGPEAAKVRLVLDDGEIYPHEGKLLFSEATVDPTTGQVTLRGEFPNPASELLPGMYVRVQIVQGVDPDALAVPQQAVRRNDAGASEVFVLRDDNRAVVQPIRLGRAVGDHWLIDAGPQARRPRRGRRLPEVRGRRRGRRRSRGSERRADDGQQHDASLPQRRDPLTDR